MLQDDEEVNTLEVIHLPIQLRRTMRILQGTTNQHLVLRRVEIATHC